MSILCDETDMAALVQAMQSAPAEQLPRIENLLLEFPEDARLHFLRGSVLVSESRPIEAHRALTRAVELAPDFAIARFQLGLFQLTSGEAENALETFGRLDRLPDGHYLRMFVDGLRCLIRDDFYGTIEHLRRGILANSENPPLNNDMQMLIDRCLTITSSTQPAGQDDMVSETSLVLRQFTDRRNLN